MTTSWTELYERYARVEALRRDRALGRAALAEHRAWCDGTCTRVMQEIARVAELRAREFARATKGAVSVTHPSRPPLEQPDGSARMTFLELRLHEARVDVYSHRGAGGLPYFHLASIPNRPHGRVFSVAGCFAARVADSYELRDAAKPARPSSVEALVLRAFQLLVEGSRQAA